MSYHASAFYHHMLKVNIFYIARFPIVRQKNAMIATIQTKWKHNPGCVDIVAEKHLDRRDRSEPSYEHFSEHMSRVSGGARRPQMTRLMEQPAYTAAAWFLHLD